MWEKKTNATGHIYYKNVDTNETRWDPPSPSSLLPLPPPPSQSGLSVGGSWILYKKDGHPYYYNEVTKDSLWSEEWEAIYSPKPPNPPHSHSVSFNDPPTSNLDSIDIAFRDILNSPLGQEQLKLEVDHLKGQVERGVRKVRVKDSLLEDVIDRVPEGVKKRILGEEEEEEEDSSDSDSDSSDSGNSESDDSDDSDESDLEAGEESESESDSDDSSDSDSDEEEEPSNPFLKFIKNSLDSLEPVYDRAVDNIFIPGVSKIKKTGILTKTIEVFIMIFVVFKDLVRKRFNTENVISERGRGDLTYGKEFEEENSILRRRQKPVPMPKMPVGGGFEEKKFDLYTKDN